MEPGGDQKPKRPKFGGRKAGTPNKVASDIKALAQLHGPDAIKVCVDIMQGKTFVTKKDSMGRETKEFATLDTRVRAAQFLIERGYGKSPQPIEGTGQDGAIVVEFKGFD